MNNEHASEPMRLPWWMRMREAGHYAAEVGHYASSGGGIMLQVVDANPPLEA